MGFLLLLLLLKKEDLLLFGINMIFLLIIYFKRLKLRKCVNISCFVLHVAKYFRLCFVWLRNETLCVGRELREKNKKVSEKGKKE